MKFHDNDIIDVVLKVLGAIGVIYLAHRILKIYKGIDNKLSEVEFGKFSGYVFFMWAGWYVITKEGNRPSNSEHVFSEMWLFLIFGGLITVLHLDDVIEKFGKILELIARIRAKLPPPNSEPAATEVKPPQPQ